MICLLRLACEHAIWWRIGPKKTGQWGEPRDRVPGGLGRPVTKALDSRSARQYFLYSIPQEGSSLILSSRRNLCSGELSKKAEVDRETARNGRRRECLS